MRFLAAGLLVGGYGLLAQPVATPSWDELLRQLVASLAPMLVGALVHWIGAYHGARTARAASLAATDAANTP